MLADRSRPAETAPGRSRQANGVSSSLPSPFDGGLRRRRTGLPGRRTGQHAEEAMARRVLESTTAMITGAADSPIGQVVEAVAAFHCDGLPVDARPVQ